MQDNTEQAAREEARLLEEARQKLDKVCGDVHAIKIALVGDERLGVPGVIAELRDLKNWRTNLDLRIATISGAIAGIAMLLKWYFGH